MNQSKTGLNESFYKWIDDIRRAYRKQNELEKKLVSLNLELSQLTTSKFAQIKIISSSRATYDRVLDALSRIEEVEKKMSKWVKIIEEFQEFKKSISDEESIILNLIVEKSSVKEQMFKMSLTRSGINYRKNDLIRLWYTIMQKI